jgi:hypothetical protein
LLEPILEEDAKEARSFPKMQDEAVEIRRREASKELPLASVDRAVPGLWSR